jgi:hypothetical protein
MPVRIHRMQALLFSSRMSTAILVPAISMFTRRLTLHGLSALYQAFITP